MTDTWRIDKWQQMINLHLPRGEAIPRHADSNRQKWVRAVATVFAVLDENIEAIAKEWMPQYTLSRLEDWVTATTSKNDCGSYTNTIDGQRARVLAKLRLIAGGMDGKNGSAAAFAYLEAVAERLGYDVTISKGGRCIINVKINTYNSGVACVPRRYGEPYGELYGDCGYALLACILHKYVRAAWDINFIWPHLWDEDAVAIMARMETPPSDTLAYRIDRFVRALKAAEIWDALDTLYVPVKGETGQARLLDWKRPVSAELLGAASSSSDNGFEAGYSGGIDTNFAPAVDGVNVADANWMAFCWITTMPVMDDYDVRALMDFGAALFVRDSISLLNGYANNMTVIDYPASAAVVNELYAIGRDSDTTAAVFQAGTSLMTSGYYGLPWSGSTTQQLLPTDEEENTGAIGIWGMGAYLSPTQLAQLKTAIQHYLA